MIDGSHVRIKVLKDNAVDYLSTYQQHDFKIQAVVNDQKLFLHFGCGYPGSMHDARVLRCSVILRRAEGGDILIAPAVKTNGKEIGPYFDGDNAYPLTPGYRSRTQKVLEIVMTSSSTRNFPLQS